MENLSISSEDLETIFITIEKHIADHRGDGVTDVSNLERILNNIAFQLADGVG